MSNPAPIPNESKPVWEMVIEDMHDRDQFGRAKYHTPLQMSNDRDHALDAYEEVLDLCVYFKQVTIERAALRSEVERLANENEGMRKALAGVPDPAAFMVAVDAVLVSYDYIMKHGPTLEKGDLGIQLDRLKAARGKH